jgi:peptide/nickel transport system substrate-binding protein
LWYTPTHYGDAEVDLATMLKSQWEATGLMAVDVQSAEWAAYYDKWTNKQMPVFLLGFYPDYVDPDNYMFLLGSTEGGKVIGTDYSNPAWDKAMAEALSTTDRDKREEIYRTLQTQWPGEVPTAPIFQGSLYLFLQKNIAGESFTPSGGLVYCNLYKE